MEIFNIFCGICSIADLLVSLFTVGKVIKISKTYNCDNKNDYSKVINRGDRNTYHGSYSGRNGNYIGRDNNTVNIVTLRDSEREFVVTNIAGIKPAAYFTGRETELHELRQMIEERRKFVLVRGMGGIGKTHICKKLFEKYIKKHVEGENGPFSYIGYIEHSGDMESSLQKCPKFKKVDNS